MAKLKLAIIVGSNRRESINRKLAQALAKLGEGAFDVSFVQIDDLPMFNQDLESNRPESTLRLKREIEAADAILIVTPEHNRSIPAVLKTALAFLNHEWRYKPAGIVSYGGVSAGTRAAVALRSVLTTLRMVPAVDAVHIPFVGEKIADDGTLVANDVMVAAAKTMLDEIERLRTGIAPLRPAP